MNIDKQKNMGMLLGDQSMVDSYLGGEALRTGMPTSVTRQQYPDYMPPQEQETDWQWPDLSGLMPESLGDAAFAPVKSMLQFGSYMQPARTTERLYDVFDASMEGYLSDEERAALPFGDPRKDAISSLAIGAAETVAPMAMKVAPKLADESLKMLTFGEIGTRDVLGHAPEFINQMNRRLGLPEMPFEKRMIMGDKDIPKPKLDMAKQMEAEGASRDEINSKLGVFKGLDGKWRMEIPDNEAALLEYPEDLESYADLHGGGYTGYTVGDLIQHETLENVNPYFMSIPVYPVRGGGGTFKRAYNPAKGYTEDMIHAGVDVDPDEFLDTILHEVQHGIQEENKLLRGGTPEEFDPTVSFREANITYQMGQRLDELAGSDVAKLLEAAQGDARAIIDIKKMYPEEYEDINRLLGDFRLTDIQGMRDEGNRLMNYSQTLTPEGRYHRLSGEVEARNVERRRRMTPEGRRDLPPYATEDVTPEEQIMKLTGKHEAIGESVTMGKSRYPKQPRMSRDDAVAAGYWHPVGADKKLPIPYPEMTRGIEPAHDLVPWRAADWESMQGGTLIPAVGDRTEAGQWLKSVGGYGLSDDVLLEGGHDFMRSHDPYGSIWASDKGVIKTLHNKARDAYEAGSDPYLSFMPMGHGASNFNTMMSDALLGQMQTELKTGQISKTAKGMFDREMRKLRPEWKGIDHPDTMRMLDDNGALRHAFVSTVQKDVYQKRGFPNVGETRFAITDPNLMDTPLHQGGQAVGRITDEDIMYDPLFPHKTYNTQLGGQYMGGDIEGIPRDILFPDFAKSRRAAGVDPAGDYRSFHLGIPTQQMDQEWLDQLMKHLQGRQG